jgi:hypothetical protein
MLERVRVLAYATIIAIIDEIQREPWAVFNKRDLRLGKRRNLSSSSWLPSALNVILSHKNEIMPMVKRMPPAARNTGNPVLCRLSPYWTIASGTWSVEAKVADDALIVEEQNHSWEEFPLEHMANMAILVLT